MKVILSRKGFDSSAGGYPSPILQDGTMLSMPIPGGNSLYLDLSYMGKPYSAILANLSNNKFVEENCHLDPDIRRDIRTVPEEWIAAFGQTGNAQSYLTKIDVQPGDIFLFFWVVSAVPV